MVSVYIPTPFRGYVGNRTNVEVEASNVAGVIDTLEQRYPGFRDLCCDATGAIPAHINIYVNNVEITTLNGPATELNEGDQVAVIPALAGGAPDEPSGSVALTPERVTRYSRHIIMGQVGPVGQRKIMDA